MAFTPETLFTASGVFNATSYGRAPAIHTYQTQDILSFVLAPNYFPPFFNTDPDNIRALDVIFLECADFNLVGLIDSVDPVFITPFIDFPSNVVLETNVEVGQVADGPWTFQQSFVMDCNKQNHEGLITFPNVFDTATGLTNVITFLNDVPAEFVPQYTTRHTVWIQNNSLDEVGILTFTDAGVITIERANGIDFDPTGNAGFYSGSIKYKTV